MEKKDFGVDELVHTGELYDYVNTFDDDIPFYNKWAKDANGDVLELCCGTGRITIPLALSGINITGLDISDSMLEKARSKSDEKVLSINFVKGDMTDFNLNKKYSLIFIPFNSLQNIYKLEDVESIFRNIKRHLSNDGIFILDIFNPDIALMYERTDKTIEQSRFVDKLGREIVIKETIKYDAASQVNRVRWIHVIDGVETIQNLDMRCFYPQEMDALLKYNGFKIIHKFGNFDESRFTSLSPKQLFICK